MLASLTKRIGDWHSLGSTFFNLSYTWSHELDDSSGQFRNTQQVPAYNHHQFYSSGDSDVRNRLVLSGGWELPFAHLFSNGPKALTQGRSLYPIVFVQSGLPMDVVGGLSIFGLTDPSGAASRGFGALVAERALAKGDGVVATARNPKAIAERFGEHPNLLAVALDVTNEDQAVAAARAAIDRFAQIDVLLNNDGFGLMGAVEEASAAEIEAVYRTNVFGLLTVSRAVLPYMRKARSGRILNISSIGGYRGAPGFGVYSSTKFAVMCEADKAMYERKGKRLMVRKTEQ